MSAHTRTILLEAVLKKFVVCFALGLLAASGTVDAQFTGAPAGLMTARPQSQAPAVARAQREVAALQAAKQAAANAVPKPFSRVAVSAGISAMGVNMQVATNVNKYINVRATGNYFSYTMSNQSFDDYTVNGKLDFATAGLSADFYPFPKHGLRFSPGVQFYNQNGATANVAVKGGTSLSLNDVDYYSSSTNPIQGTAEFGLNTRKQAFTATTGWGNLISRKASKHWSFPVELGVAFVDAPTVKMALNSGQACNASGQNCVNVTDYAELQSNLQAQVKKYQDDVNMLKFYPIFSFGVGYSFHIR